MLYPFVAISTTAHVRLDTIVAVIATPGGCRVHVNDGDVGIGTYPSGDSVDTILARMSKAASGMHP